MVKLNPIVRAVGVIGVTAGLVTGVTFAALSSSATLTDNTISSVTADLVVNNNVADETFSESETGFTFDGLVPGVYSAPKSFQLRNMGDTALDVAVQITSEEALPAGVNADDITFRFTPTDPAGTPMVWTWGQLTPTGGQMLIEDFAANEEDDVTYTVEVKISDTVTTESVDISEFNFTFSGAVSAPAEEEPAPTI